MIGNDINTIRTLPIQSYDDALRDLIRASSLHPLDSRVGALRMIVEAALKRREKKNYYRILGVNLYECNCCYLHCDSKLNHRH